MSERTRGARGMLLVSYYFPPDAAVGALRIAKFARTLPELGWTPVVLTVRDEYRDQGIDPERLRGLETVTVVRTGELPRVWKRMRTAIGRLARWAGGYDSARARRTDGDSPGTRHARETLLATVKRWLISLAVLLPDDRKHWSVVAAFTAVRLIRRAGIDCVLTSGPPFSTHLVGVAAAIFTRARWIADFRDPWIDMLPERFPNTRSTASDFLERRMEALVVKLADTLVATTPRMLRAMRMRYPRVRADRFVCIPNSIDPAAAPIARPEKYGPLTITYAGSLYFDRTPEPLFRAVSESIAAGQIRAADIRIKLVGRCRVSNGTETAAMARRYGLADVVEVLDPVPYPESLRIMQRSHLLLVLAPRRHELVVPAKVYDYLGTGTKLLAIAEEGATSDLMAQTASGRCFSERDIAGLRAYLERLVNDGNFEELVNGPESFARFGARHLTQRLCAVLSERPAQVRPGMVESR